MLATEICVPALENKMKSFSAGSGTRINTTWGPPGGHQKMRSDRENTWFYAQQKWWPPLLLVLNINSNESGGHRPLRA